MWVERVKIGAGAPNLIPNPGFEDGVAGWATDGAIAPSTARVHSGRASGVFTPGFALSPAAAPAYVAGHTYTMRVWVYVPSGQGLNLSGLITALGDYSAAGGWSESYGNAPTAFDTWQEIRVTHLVREGFAQTYTRTLWYVPAPPAGGAVIYVDDVELVDVELDGRELVDLDEVLADVVIRHGRTGAYDAVNAATAQVTLLGQTRSETAGFHVGIPLAIDAGGAPRFVGTVTDATLDDDELTLIAAGPLSTLSRYSIGAGAWPAERWSDRVTRAFAEAGVAELLLLQYDVDFDPLLVARGDDPEQPAAPVDLLSYLGTLADDVAAAIADTPDGRVLVQQLTYRDMSGTLTWATAPGAWADVHAALAWNEAGGLGPGPLPVLHVDPADVLYVPPWEQTLAVENQTTVTFGDQESVTVAEPASVERFGPIPGGVSTQLLELEDATRRASERVRRLAFPRWVITSAPLLRGHPLTIGQIVELSGFPPASPHAAWRPLLEGWTDTIRGEDWNVELALSDPQLSGVLLMWVDVPAELAWTAVAPACDWKDAVALDALYPPLHRIEELTYA